MTNDIELRWKKIKSYVGHGGKKRSKKDRPYTHVEIAKMIEEADQKGKIAILYTLGNRPCSDHALLGNRTKSIGMPCMIFTLFDLDYIFRSYYETINLA